MLEFILVILVAAGAFGVCFLVDKGFQKLFRSKPQHMSGLSVRLNRRYAAFGLILIALGFAAVFAGMKDNWLFIVAGAVLALVGVGLVAYYMSFSIFYDDEGFILSTFGKKPKAYTYRAIQSQQLFTGAGNVTLVELRLTDGRSVQLQSAMSGVYPFLDKASACWMRQQGLTEEQCPFYDPQNSHWFPDTEG